MSVKVADISSPFEPDLSLPHRASDVTAPDPNSKWDILPKILETTGLFKLQLNSFNDFVDFGLTRILKANREVVFSENPRIFIRYKSIHVEKPKIKNSDMPLLPQQCRLSDSTYAGNVYVEYDFVNNKKVTPQSKVLIAKLPIMLRSNRCHLDGIDEAKMAEYDECPHDPGCYFLVNGSERVVLVQEQNPYNRILIEPSSFATRAAVVNSSTETHKTRVELLYKKDLIVLHHNSLSEDIPLFVLFRALGVNSDQEVIQLVDPSGKVDDLLMASLQEALKLNILTQESAFQFIERRLRVSGITGIETTREERAMPNYKAREFLRSLVLPHIDSSLFDFKKKAVFLGVMTRWLLLSLRDEKLIDGRDFFGNKRLELAGELLDLLFEDLFKSYNTTLQKTLARANSRTKGIDATAVANAMRKDSITHGLNMAISSGNWNITRFKMQRAGVSQLLGRMSYIQFVSMVTRISSHFEKTQKVSGARSLYPSQFGFICPSDTPEGAQCGLVKNFSLTAHVTVWSDPSQIRRLLFDIGLEDLTLMTGEEIHEHFIVMVNGDPLGVVSDYKELLRRFKELRRAGWIDRFAAIWSSIPKRCVFISTESGRICRPLIVVRNGKSMYDPSKTFTEMIDTGCIEYVDVNEQTDSLIAFSEAQIESANLYNKSIEAAAIKEDPSMKDSKDFLTESQKKIVAAQTHTEKIEFTHLEIDSGQMLGLCAGVVPCPHHNQSPRNTYQCAMGKQAVGPTAYNIMHRADKSTYFLCYPQQPMVQTRHMRLANYHELPSGQAAMVAIMSYSGHDIEDALVMNKASLDRGFARRYYLSKLDLMLKSYQDSTVKDVIVNLDKDRSIDTSTYRYQCLDNDGLVKSGSRLTLGQVYANKFVPKSFEGTIQHKDQRSAYKSKYPVMVQNVSIANTERGQVVKIKTRDFRRPELGDKFSSRHGQKGVVGLIVEQEDMPFTETGVFPDIIMNPHGFPSRMTVGKMIELISGKAGLFKGKIGNGTVFSSDRVKDISEDLVAAGYSYSGKEVLTSGITGEPLHAYVFFGPVFYQSLKHMVKDKMQARARGPTTMLTRQPTQGRNREGGMRLGEMERDCLIGYGAANILYERMLLSSDVYEADICGKCGFLGFRGRCVRCGGGDDMKTVRMPYACKLLFHEMMSMGIAPRVKLEDL